MTALLTRPAPLSRSPSKGVLTHKTRIPCPFKYLTGMLNITLHHAERKRQRTSFLFIVMMAHLLLVHMMEKQGFKNYLCLFSPSLSHSSAGRIESSFTPHKLPDEEGLNEMFEPPTKEPDSQPEACHTPSSCPEICKQTVNTSGAQSDDKTTWNVEENEPEYASGSRITSKPSEEAASKGNELNNQPLSDFVVKYIDHTEAEIVENDQTEGAVVQSELTQIILEHNKDPNMDVTVQGDADSKTTADKEKNTENMEDAGKLVFSDIHQKERQCETNFKENTELPINTEAGQKGEDRDLLEVTHISGEENVKSAGKFVP